MRQTGLTVVFRDYPEIEATTQILGVPARKNWPPEINNAQKLTGK